MTEQQGGHPGRFVVAGSRLNKVRALPTKARDTYRAHRTIVRWIGLGALVVGVLVLTWSLVASTSLVMVLIGAAITTVGVGSTIDTLAERPEGSSGGVASRVGRRRDPGACRGPDLDRGSPAGWVAALVLALLGLALIAYALGALTQRWPLPILGFGLGLAGAGVVLLVGGWFNLVVAAAMNSCSASWRTREVCERGEAPVPIPEARSLAARGGRRSSAWSPASSRWPRWLCCSSPCLPTDRGTCRSASSGSASPSCSLPGHPGRHLAGRRSDSLDPRAVGIFGMVFVAFGIYLLARTGLTTVGLLVLLGILLALAGAFIVWRGEGLFLVVVLGFVLVWGVLDRSATVSGAPETVVGNATAYVVALGDSYISGEGAPRFFEGTDKDGDRGTKNECRRVPTAYAPLVAEELGMGLGFFACLEHDDGPDQRRRAGDRALADRSTRGIEDGLEPDERIAVAGLGEHRRQRGPVRRHRQGMRAPRHLRRTARSMVAEHRDLRRRPSAQPTKPSRSRWLPRRGVAMPYPMLLTEDVCNASPLDQAEHEFLTEFITVLDEQLRASAARAASTTSGDGMFAFGADGICGTGRAMNVVKLQPSEGNLADRLNRETGAQTARTPPRRAPSLRRRAGAGTRGADPSGTANP